MIKFITIQIQKFQMYLKQETGNYHMPYVRGVKTFFNHTRGKATSKTNCSLKRLLESHTETTILRTQAYMPTLEMCLHRSFEK